MLDPTQECITSVHLLLLYTLQQVMLDGQEVRVLALLVLAILRPALSVSNDVVLLIEERQRALLLNPAINRSIILLPLTNS